MRTAKSRIRAKFYEVSEIVTSTAVKLCRHPVDFPDEELGWGRVPGYWERKMKELRGLLPVEPNVVYKVESGFRWHDWVTGVLPGEELISERAKLAFAEFGVTGIELIPVIVDHDPPPPYPYYRVIVKGCCGPVRTIEKSIGGYLFEFNCDAWDGSDIFVGSLGSAAAFVFATQKVREAKRRYRLQMGMHQDVYCV
jgi:hypothetical protein